MALDLDYISDFFFGYCLGVYLSVCKRISVDDQYFIVIFMFKVGNIVQNLDLAVWLTVNKTR